MPPPFAPSQALFVALQKIKSRIVKTRRALSAPPERPPQFACRPEACPFPAPTGQYRATRFRDSTRPGHPDRATLARARKDCLGDKPFSGLIRPPPRNASYPVGYGVAPTAFRYPTAPCARSRPAGPIESPRQPAPNRRAPPGDTNARSGTTASTSPRVRNAIQPRSVP